MRHMVFPMSGCSGCCVVALALGGLPLFSHAACGPFTAQLVLPLVAAAIRPAPLDAGGERPAQLLQLLVRRARSRSRLGDVRVGTLGTSPPSKAALFPVEVTYSPEHHSSWEGATLSIDRSTQQLKATPGISPESAIAWARFTDELSTTGWTELTVETSESSRVSNSMKMYGAGFVEGLLTATRMSQFYSNFWQLLAKDAETSAALVNVQNMMYKELEYVKNMSGLYRGPASDEPDDAYWKHVRYLFLQLWGIKDGYNAVALRKARNTLDLLDVVLINSHAELPELMEAYTPKALESRRSFQALAVQPSRAATLLQRAIADRRAGGETAGLPAGGPAGPASGRPRRLRGGPAERRRSSERRALTALRTAADQDWERRLAKRGHCSALVRLTEGNKKLFVGHTTWNDYSKMTRVFKYYNFRLPGSSTAASLIGFSSYPGCVSSTDDFYIMDSGLTTMDTSLEVLNPRLYDRVPDFPANPHIPSFMHVMVVNRLAHTAMDWTNLFASRNSGVPSAQWLVIDYNTFTPGAAMPDNVVRLVEQVPGLTHQADISQQLASLGYWASYNRPFFPTVREASGHASAEDKYGALYSYDKGPRAVIFKHLAGSVNDLFGMRSVMNRNAFPNEGVLPEEPGHAISARMDLDTINHLPNGGIDAKVVDRCLFRSLQCQVISGPSHDAQPIFKWRSATGAEFFPGWPHFGLPDIWDFSWVQTSPSKLLPRAVDDTC